MPKFDPIQLLVHQIVWQTGDGRCRCVCGWEGNDYFEHQMREASAEPENEGFTFPGRTVI